VATNSGGKQVGKHAATFERRLEAANAAVEAAQAEALLAVQFHETWRPTVADADLRKRMGHSFATHTFHIIRMALRREVLLALMRLWDNDSRAVKLTGIAELLRDGAFFNELVRHRASRLGYSFDVSGRMREALEPKRDRIWVLIRKYTHGKEKPTLLDRLTALRHQQLAHRQTQEPTDPAELQHTDEEVEEFYQDTLEIICLLLSVFFARAFDIGSEATKVFQHHAKYFWAAARGERTEGHPFFKPHSD